MKPRVFDLTESHVKLLRQMYVGWDGCEYGAPAIDCKRPYGNSNVAEDVCEILGWPVDDEDGPTTAQCEAAETVHRETETALQIVLCTGMMRPGRYVRPSEYNSRNWQLAVEPPTRTGERTK